MSMALKYGMMKRAKKMAEGGEIKGVHETEPYGTTSSQAGVHVETGADKSAKKEHHRVLKEMHEMRGKDRKHLAEGGDVGEDDMISRIMQKHYSEGGMLSNQTPVTADFEDNEFDDLVKDDELDSSYTGSDSGDEIGDAQEDEDRRDIVSRIMRSRAKGDRMPRPA